MDTNACKQSITNAALVAYPFPKAQLYLVFDASDVGDVRRPTENRERNRHQILSSTISLQKRSQFP